MKFAKVLVQREFGVKRRDDSVLGIQRGSMAWDGVLCGKRYLEIGRQELVLPPYGTEYKFVSNLHMLYINAQLFSHSHPAAGLFDGNLNS